MVDANQGYSRAQAVEFARYVWDLDIRWFEEPVRWTNDARWMRDVRYQTGIPVCAGQSETTLTGIRDLMIGGAIDVSNFDASWAGGPTIWRKAAGLAAAFGVELGHHEEPQIASHLLASVPDHTFVECFDEERDPFFWRLSDMSTPDRRRPLRAARPARLRHRARLGLRPRPHRGRRGRPTARRSSEGGSHPMASVTGFFHGGITVSDMDRSLAFYREGLGLEQAFDRILDGPYLPVVLGLEFTHIRAVYLHIPGGGFVELLEYVGIERLPAASRPCDYGGGHLCLYVDDVEAMHARLVGLGYRGALGRRRRHHGRAQRRRPELLHDRPRRLRRSSSSRSVPGG